MVRAKGKEAPTPFPVVAKLLGSAGEDLVLVGGQALAIWVRWYEIGRLAERTPAITDDVDFLARSRAARGLVARCATAIDGEALIPEARAMTALVGQAIRQISDEEYLNVDVIDSVVGIRGDAVRKRAVKVALEGVERPFLLMHPLDVLYSRLINLHKLPDKKNDKGRLQLALAIEVGRKFLQRAAGEEDADALASGRSPIQDFVSEIERMAVEDAGRKVAKRDGIFVADAIDPHLIAPGPFWEKRWPALKKLMSPEYAATIREPS